MAYSEEALAFSTIPTKDQVRLEDRVSYLYLEYCQVRAGRRGARAIGYELQPLLVLISRWLSRHDEKVSVRLANFWRTPLPDETTVVYLFGDGRDIAKMVQYLQHETNRLRHDIWLLSYGFEAAGLALHKTVGAHNLYLLQPQS